MKTGRGDSSVLERSRDVTEEAVRAEGMEAGEGEGEEGLRKGRVI